MKFLKGVLKSLLALLALLFLASITVVAVFYFSDWYATDSDPREEIVIRGGILFDAVNDTPRPNPGMVLRDGRIACIGDTCPAGDDAIVINAEGLSIVPGLVELHGHFFGYRESPSIAELLWETIRMRPALRKELHAAGITSYRSLGDPRDAIFEVKQAIETRELYGPRMFVVGPIFTAPGGHPSYGGRDPNPSGVGGLMTFQSEDQQAIRLEIDRLAANGADGIKAVYGGDYYDTETGRRFPSLDLVTLTALIDSANQHDLWVAVHVGPGPESAQAALAGATTIEHGVRNGNLIDATTLEVLASNEVIYVPTLGQEPGAEVNIPALYGAGVSIGVATDVGDYHDELARLVDAGMTDVDVLIAATRVGAKALQQSDLLGTLEIGKAADVLLVEGEPWRDIRHLRQVRTVIQDGYVVMASN